MTTRQSPNESLPLLTPSPGPRRRRSSRNGIPHALEFLNVLNEITPEVRRTAQVIFAISLFTNIMFMSFVPIKFLYLKSIGFVSSSDDSDITFFVYMMVLESFIPFFGMAATGYIASRIGSRHTFILLSVAAVTGILLLIQASASKYRGEYIVGWILLRFANSIQVVRVIVLAECVPPRERTTVMAIHEIWGPLGCVVGPLVWIFCGLVTSGYDTPILGVFRLNMYTLTCIVMTALAVGIGLISWFGLQNYNPYSQSSTAVENSHTQNSAEAKSVGPDFVNMYLNYGGIDHFHISGAHLGIIYEAIYLLAFIPQFLLAYLSRILQDRSILLIGLVLKLSGFLLFFPYFNNRVYVWQAVCGYLLIVQASRFFRTASLSLASKLLGPMSNGTLLGMLSSASQIGPAVAQFCFAKLTVDLFGTYYYVLIGIPGIIALAMVVWPSSWESLDPNREFCQMLFKNYKQQEHKSRSEEYNRK